MFNVCSLGRSLYKICNASIRTHSSQYSNYARYQYKGALNAFRLPLQSSKYSNYAGSHYKGALNGFRIPPRVIVNRVILRGMANKRHKKTIKLAKGFKGRANRIYSVAKPRVNRSRVYAYRDRKVKKRDFRLLWIQRINAGCRMYGLKYSHFINNLLHSNIGINRKVLADLAVNEPLSFKSIVYVAGECAKSPLSLPSSMKNSDS